MKISDKLELAAPNVSVFIRGKMYFNRRIDKFSAFSDISSTGIYNINHFEQEVVSVRETALDIFVKNKFDIVLEKKSFNDFYGYTSCLESLLEETPGLMDKYGIDEASTLKVVAVFSMIEYTSIVKKNGELSNALNDIRNINSWFERPGQEFENMDYSDAFSIIENMKIIPSEKRPQVKIREVFFDSSVAEYTELNELSSTCESIFDKAWEGLDMPERMGQKEEIRKSFLKFIKEHS